VKNCGCYHRDSSFELIVLVPHCETLVWSVSTPSMMPVLSRMCANSKDSLFMVLLISFDEYSKQSQPDHRLLV